MVKKIIELSKIFIKDYFQNLYIFNNNTKKINKKSIFAWLLLITIVVEIFLSFKVINWLDIRGQAILFLKIYFPITATIFMFQAVLVCSNVFFFSKDLEYILPLPIKPIELLIAKFNTVISITYGMELIFLVIPLFIFGMITTTSLGYFLTMIIVLILFPIFLITVISIIMLFVMQLTRFIKNKDIFQILLVIILSFIMSASEIYLINSIFNNEIIQLEINDNSEVEGSTFSIENFNNKLDKLNDYFLIINPCISLLTNFKLLNLIFQLFKLIILSLLMLFIFIFAGKFLYLNNILKNIAYINKKKNNNKIKKIKYKKNEIKKSYIKTEFKKIVNNPTFFLQCIFQYIFLTLILILIINLFIPTIIDNFKKEDFLSEIGKDNFILQIICIILGLIQIIFTLGNLSLTSISREGKNAIVLKYIPIQLYKQFIWKSIPQIILNILPILGIGIVIAINIPHISVWYYILTSIIAILLNIINSFIMLIIDFKKPNLDWITETSALKDNGNKLYQYVTTIIIILLLIYFTKIFENVNVIISLLSIIFIFFTILFLINLYIKKHINKLFEKIH